MGLEITPKKKILFVDDDPNALARLKECLAPCQDYEPVYVSSGLTALTALESSNFDILVSDLEMPRMDGMELLRETKKKYPGIIRIALFENDNMSGALKVADIAQQVLKKTCSAMALREVISRSCAMQDLLEDKKLRKLIGKIDALPTLPAVYTAINKALGDPNTSLKSIANLVEQDMGLSLKILQVVNSPYFGMTRTISNIQSAVSLLGILMIRNLTLSIELFRGLKRSFRKSGFSLESLQKHSLTTARIAASLLTDKQDSENAWTAGLLHDVGKLIVETHMPDQCDKITQMAIERKCPTYVVEKEVWGVTHAEIGSYLLGLWGLPYPIVEAVAFHHTPIHVEQQHFDILGAVYVADKLAHQIENVKLTDRTATVPAEDSLNQDYIKKFGIEEQVTKWLSTEDQGSSGFEAARSSVH